VLVLGNAFITMGHGVNAWYSGSILVEITLPISPYKINDSNEHGCYFKKCYYFNI
jgi:hypothetical protein